MNKQERIIAFLLGLALVAWLFHSSRQAAERSKIAAESAQATTADTVEVAPNVKESQLSATDPVPQAKDVITPPPPIVPEEFVKLNGGDMTLLLSTHGATLKRVTLNQYLTKPGRAAEDNPAVAFDLSETPGLELAGVPGLAVNAAWQVADGSNGQSVTFTTLSADGIKLTRHVELQDDYRIKVTDTLRNMSTELLRLETNSISIGALPLGSSKNDMLSIDSLPAVENAKVRYWDKEAATKKYLVGGRAGGGCGGGSRAVTPDQPQRVTVPVIEPQKWVAIKSRFFVTGFSSLQSNCGFTVSMARDTTQSAYTLDEVSVRMLFTGSVLAQGESLTRDYSLYIGPKRLALLQKLGNGMDAVMQFGWFTWFCKLLVPTLNFFYRLIPNYGVAIILLTFLVRIIFWPLTHKSTVSMRRMQKLQPKLKELQTKFKDNPQKMQQETWALYREHKVNPMSSCLPMLIQIPVFIALFSVLRSSVELRYAPFLWVVDLSEPENLLAGVLPLPLNILPILMSVTMALQSYLTPTTGDPQQQRMMMVMMPIMMLFMFYSFPSALALYWTVSQVLSIAQMLWIRHKSKQQGESVIELPPARLSRQQRRHG